jgi:hypothetical protein
MLWRAGRAPPLVESSAGASTTDSAARRVRVLRVLVRVLLMLRARCCACVHGRSVVEP